MQTSRTAHRLAFTVIVTFAALAGGTTVAQSAAAAEPPPSPVDRAVLDAAQVVWPMPEGMEYDFTPQERIDGLLGLNDLPGGPLGSFPQPASKSNPEMMPGFPGTGYYGMVADLTGINPRKPADEQTQAGRDLYGSADPASPSCDQPDACDASSFEAVQR